MLPAPEAAAAFCARHLSLAAPSGGDEIRHALAALIRREREAMREACAAEADELARAYRSNEEQGRRNVPVNPSGPVSTSELMAQFNANRAAACERLAAALRELPIS